MSQSRKSMVKKTRRGPHLGNKKRALAPQTVQAGFEPATSTLTVWRSTTELLDNILFIIKTCLL